MSERESWEVPREVAAAVERARRALRRVEDAMLPPMEDVGDTPGEEWWPVMEAKDAADEAVNNMLRAYVAARSATDAALGEPRT